MTKERRRHERRIVSLVCGWEGSSPSSPGRVTDISIGGCYVTTRSVPTLGQAIELDVQWNDLRMVLRGTVTQAQFGIGFAVEFAGLDEPTAGQIRSLLASMEA